MLYRPNFCCHCGEKVTRAKWTPLTSRRFCDFCAVEQKQHDLLPRAAMIMMMILAAAGITSYLGGGKSASQSSPSTVQKKVMTPASPSPQIRTTAAPVVPGLDNAQPNTKQLAPKTNSSTEPVHYCGALTKKGTACTRRVKSRGRCWQHLDQPSEGGERK